MYGHVISAAFLAFLFFMPSVCLAQHTQQVLDVRYQQLETWLEAYEKWEEWTLRWGNRIAYNSAGGMIKERPERPEPPPWLWEDCRAGLALEGRLERACQILSHWDLRQLLLNRSSANGQTRQDTVPKSSFLQRVHLSGGWVPAQLPAPKVYLVAGMQIGIVEIGRATLPAVGVGLMALADGTGGYEWKPATVVGIGYRLTSFAFPWINREANLHINVARATVHGVANSPFGLDPNQNLIGFSLTFARR